MRTTETMSHFRISRIFSARVRKSQSNKFMKERRTVWSPAFSQAFVNIEARFLRFPYDLPTANSETVMRRGGGLASPGSSERRALSWGSLSPANRRFCIEVRWRN